MLRSSVKSRGSIAGRCRPHSGPRRLTLDPGAFLEALEWMRDLIFAGNDFVDRRLAPHRVLDRVLRGRVVVVVDLLVVRRFPVDENAADADKIFGLLLRDYALGH